jgi:hypothetical protein
MYAYDDAGRSYTQTVTAPGAPQSQTTVEYDADGLTLRSFGQAGGATNETLFTTTGRGQVCK